MAKVPPKQGEPWTRADVALLRKEAKQNTPTRILALHLGRTVAAVQGKAGAIKLSLKPTNQRPYGTAKKKRK
jgi:hypothetical protein